MPGSMISTRFCPVCGAANDEAQTHCFACGQRLLSSVQETPGAQGKLLRERYRLGTTLGSGGYSAVYRGWDTQDGDRTVAVKQITLQGLDAEETIEATNTYNREVEALSTLHHPQVPRLYDHFSDPDHWYLVLDYIEGQTLESYLETRATQKRPFSIEEVIGIGLQLCTVLTYLHSCHPPVIFRDLKPDNIMRTPAGKLLLIDFGIARYYIPGQSRDTQSLGSPGYAAPEQYGKAQTDARTDLYGLGALLHQLLSGQDPSDTPRGLPPLRLNGQLGSVALENLVNHLLASAPQNRPASARDIARELEHIRQQRASALDSTRIWRPPVPQNYSASQIQQQFQLLQQATQFQRKRVSRRKVVAGIVGTGVVAALTAGGFGAYAAFGSNAGASPPASTSRLALPAPNSATRINVYTGHTDFVRALCWSPNGRRVASASVDTTVQIWDARDGGNISIYKKHGSPINAVAWSPMLTGYDMVSADAWGSVHVWSAENTLDGRVLSGHKSVVNALAWESIQTGVYFVAVSDDGKILLQNITTLEEVEVYHQLGAINSVAYSPEGSYLAVGGFTQEVTIWSTQTYQKMYATYTGHTGAITSVNWLPGGTYLVSASSDQTARVWDVVNGNTLITYSGHTDVVNAVSPSPDGRYIASASDDGTVHVWSAFDGSATMVYDGHAAPVTCVAWSPDGSMLASGSHDETVQIWSGSPLP